MSDLFGGDKMTDVTGKAKSAAALAKHNAERAAEKARKAAESAQEGAGAGVATQGEGEQSKEGVSVVKSLRDLDLFRDRLF